MKSFLFVSSIFFLLISCGIRTNQIYKNDTIPSLSGKLYLVAPELDTTDCHVYGECDCCAGNMIFLNDSVFVSIGYCIGNDSYMKGKYKIQNNIVSFVSDSLFVNKERNWETETDTIHKDLPDYFIKTKKEKPVTFEWTKFDCKGKVCFKTGEKGIPYASIDIQNKFNNIIKDLKKDSIWIKLNLK